MVWGKVWVGLLFTFCYPFFFWLFSFTFYFFFAFASVAAAAVRGGGVVTSVGEVFGLPCVLLDQRNNHSLPLWDLGGGVCA